MKQKLLLLKNLAKIILKEKHKGKKIVLCHGVFDLLHVGHIKHFKEAKNSFFLVINRINFEICSVTASAAFSIEIMLRRV